MCAAWVVLIVGLLVLYKILVFRVLPFVHQYMLFEPVDIIGRYGEGSWAVITGASSGMGEQFAYELAARRFNLVLMGSVRTRDVIKNIHTRVVFVETDFSRSFDAGFFDPIKTIVGLLGDRWRVLINNVGYRTSCLDYENMDINETKKTVAVGTLVQAELTRLAIRSFSQRPNNTCIVNITAQNSICTDLFAVNNDITVPHLACYEATNAWGYFHAKSVYEEIRLKYPQIDFLIITPGAVITKKTKDVLEKEAGFMACDVVDFVRNIINMMGVFNGVRCASYKHSLTGAFANLLPIQHIADQITSNIGVGFAKHSLIHG